VNNSKLETFVFALKENVTGASGTILKKTWAEGKIPVK